MLLNYLCDAGMHRFYSACTVHVWFASKKRLNTSFVLNFRFSLVKKAVALWILHQFSAQNDLDGRFIMAWPMAK
jgi:hypothetical protein